MWYVCFFGGISDDFFRHDARDKHKIGVNDDDNGNDNDDNFWMEMNNTMYKTLTQM